MKIFIDSSLLVEYIKETKTELLEQLITSNNECFTNAIVYSEFIFYYLAIMSGKAPLTLKEINGIKQTLAISNAIELFENFETLSINSEIIALSYAYMSKYNLLPNDSLILSTIKLNGLEYFASFDENDFYKACKAEKIVLISNIEQFNKHS